MLLNNNIMEYRLNFSCASNIAQHGNGAQMTNLFRDSSICKFGFPYSSWVLSRGRMCLDEEWRQKGLVGLSIGVK